MIFFLLLLFVPFSVSAEEDNFLDKAQTEIEQGAAWFKKQSKRVVEKGNAVFDKAVNVVYVVRTKSELRNMAKLLKLDLATGEKVPEDFSRYLQKNMENDGEDVTRDPFGTRYELHTNEEGLWVRSCGPDKRCNTSDDLKSLVLKAHRR